MNVVTGAFGYIGRHIARCLLEQGQSVRTITTHPDKPNPFGSAVQARAYNFEHPDELTRSLQGARTLFNTYWIRFEYGGATFDQAVEHTRTLFQCARRAGVEKIVHISVTHADIDSPLPYYRGKARQEHALQECGVSYAIVRPTLVFGEGDILVNNIAWLLRRFPVFPVFGSGSYRLQPVYAGDLAEIAVRCGADAESLVVDAIGPEEYTFEELVRCIAAALQRPARLLHSPPWLGLAAGRLIGLALRDIILTRDELRGLMDGLLTSTQTPNGSVRFSEWVQAHADRLGSRYASELGRHFRWTASRRR